MHAILLAFLVATLEGDRPLTTPARVLVAQLNSAAAVEDRGRAKRYVPGSADQARPWQEGLRGDFLRLMNLRGLLDTKTSIPLEPQLVSEADKGAYTLRELSLRSTPGRTFNVMVAIPKSHDGPMPAVVGIHGHGGTRMSVFDPATGPNDHIYRAFGHELARKGFVAITTDVGQHDVYETGRTLMGERLWDLMRCVDYLETLPEVDDTRIGCAGLSLGGEMAMWLAAMDTRIVATVSAGYLTMMDQMEKNHCMCWKFDGLRALADWPDVYSLIAPRALQCQNGLKEPANDFTVALARQALGEIRPIYADFGVPGYLELDVHEGAHEVDLPALQGFLIAHLKAR